MKKFDIKRLLKIFPQTKAKKASLKESDKAQARADDDGFAIRERLDKKEMLNAEK